MKSLNVLELPPELLLHIFEYLEPIFLLKTVAKVCQKWRRAIFGRKSGRIDCYKIFYGWCPDIEDVPVLRHYGADVDWKKLESDLLGVRRRWGKPSDVYLFRASCDAIDAVRILKNAGICVVGNREKCLDVWSVRGKPTILGTEAEAHGGWVSCLGSCEGDSFISGGWDSVVKFWKLREHSCQAVWSRNCHRGVMSVAIRQDLTAVATFSPTLILMDPRANESQLGSYHKIHDKAILDVRLFGNYVVTIGRDLTLRVADVRTHKRLLVRAVTGMLQGSPKCLAIRDNVAFVGDTNGCVHLFDARKDFSKFHRVPVSNKKYQITSICPAGGTFISGGTDRCVRVIAPSVEHFVINCIDLEHAVTSMDYENEVLAVGKANGCVEIHQPG